jgi:hypothetical protein
MQSEKLSMMQKRVFAVDYGRRRVRVRIRSMKHLSSIMQEHGMTSFAPSSKSFEFLAFSRAIRDFGAQGGSITISINFAPECGT